MTSFLLVQGAFEGAWYWKKLAAVLEARGHRVFRPTLTGLGERSHLLTPEVDLDTHIMDVINCAKFECLKDFTLVGHSYGGMVITGAADRIEAAQPGTISAIVYLDAALPDAGKSMLDHVLPERRDAILTSARERGDGWRVPCPTVASWGIEDPAEAEQMERLIGDHPLATMTQPLHHQGHHLKIKNKTYMVAAKYTPSPFHAFAEQTRALDDWTTIELPTHHFPMISMAADLAEMLEAASG